MRVAAQLLLAALAAGCSRGGVLVADGGQHRSTAADPRSGVAVVLTTGPTLTPESVWVMGAAAQPATGLPSLRLHQNIEWVERETIREALERARGVKKEAAELMGLSQRALSHYLAKYKID